MQIIGKLTFQRHFDDKFTARNIRDDQALANLVKISGAQIKVIGSKY